VSQCRGAQGADTITMHIFYLFSAVIHTWSDNLGALKELDLAVVLLFFKNICCTHVVPQFRI
jgi:hypothetical protein